MLDATVFTIATRAAKTPRSPLAALRKGRMRPPTGSVGDAYDNAMAESSFSMLEAELLSRVGPAVTFYNPAELRRSA